MKYSVFAILMFAFSLTVHAGVNSKKKPKVLVLMKTAGYYHKSIPAGAKAILQLGAENGFGVDTTRNASVVNTKNLKKYATIIFLNTTGTIFTDKERAALKKYINKGGGFVGVHAATDTEYDWPWYNGLVGAYFMSHPKQQNATCNTINTNHPSTKHLPAQWTRFDEWYNFKNISKQINVLLEVDEKTYEGGKNGTFHPMAWYQNYDGGRSFYTGMGHTDESYAEPLFLQHLLGGIQYAMGVKK
ncbi:MAG: ThuA domain-containing protein [Niabella sp.]